jgi:hypothetical protein
MSLNVKPRKKNIAKLGIAIAAPVDAGLNSDDKG